MTTPTPEPVCREARSDDAEEGHPLGAEQRQGLPTVSSVQRALIGLERAGLVGRSGGRAWIAEPFLSEWVRWKTG